MTDFDRLLREQAADLRKALEHLAYSHAKVSDLSTDALTLSSENLETWEGLVARFGRASDLFTSQFLRTLLLREDPGFRGSLRDLLNQAEKFGWIGSARAWLEIRELRNASVHEYRAAKISELLEAVRKRVPDVLAIERTLAAHAP